jgi:hypothetical protein
MDEYKNSLNCAMFSEKERERGGGHVLTLDAEVRHVNVYTFVSEVLISVWAAPIIGLVRPNAPHDFFAL